MDRDSFGANWHEGDRVRVVSGSFEGIVGVVVGPVPGYGHVRVRFSIYGRSVEVEVDDRMIESHEKS